MPPSIVLPSSMGAYKAPVEFGAVKAQQGKFLIANKRMAIVKGALEDSWNSICDPSRSNYGGGLC